ncbi:glycoside hydrolase family 16 protein [Bisporella sp. PMI_857]|nr:glycoside hydrolase family 16 protein [Bisporella sp. PMI_857]
MTDNYGQPLGAPPAYKESVGDLSPKWWDIRYWSWKKWVILAAGIVVLIVVLIVGIVLGTRKNNSYPNYTALSYTLVDTYSEETFFDNFDYFTGYDPAAGLVHYVPAEMAVQYNLTYASSSSAIIRVDTSVDNNTVPNAETGRFSVRLTSKKQYETGLFIFDVKHSPMGCATWPALWTSDPNNWPENGEIDIMEAVNVVGDDENQMTLHTSKGCTMKGVKRKQTGKTLTASCLNSTDENAGCGVQESLGSFGTTFNQRGGGVLAMELRTEGIRMWDFTRSSIPSDITNRSPDPSTWGEAMADFPSTDCDIASHFKNQSIIANIDLCGQWAGQAKVYSETCPGLCEDQVKYNNTAFADAYWEFGEFTIYQSS